MGSRLARGSLGLGPLTMSLCCSVYKWGEPRPTKSLESKSGRRGPKGRAQMEAVHRLRKIKQERLGDALDAMWRAKGTAFQAKGTASRKVLRLEEPGTCWGLKGSLRVAAAAEHPGCGTGHWRLCYDFTLMSSRGGQAGGPGGGSAVRRACPVGLGWGQEEAGRHRQDGFGRQNEWACWWTGRAQAATGVRMRPGFLTHVTDGRGGGILRRRGAGAMEKSIWLLPSLGCCLGDSQVGKSVGSWEEAGIESAGLRIMGSPGCAQSKGGARSTPHLEEVGKKSEHKGVRGSKTGTKMSPLDLVALKWGVWPGKWGKSQL